MKYVDMEAEIMSFKWSPLTTFLYADFQCAANFNGTICFRLLPLAYYK